MYLNKGKLGDVQIVPAEFIDDIPLSAHPEYFAKGPWADSYPKGTAYNNHFWIPPCHEGAFMAFGYQGQYLYIHPKYNIVIAKFSTHPEGDDSYLVDLEWKGLYAISKAFGTNQPLTKK